MIGYTTLEQSKKLVELGLDPFTADMLYYTLTPDIPVCKKPFIFKGQDMEIPCWSLAALISLMPNKLENLSTPNTSVWLEIGNRIVEYRRQSNIDQSTINNDETPSFRGVDLIKNAFDMVCWLIEENYIEKGETK